MSTGTNSRNPSDLHPALQRGLTELTRRMTQSGFTALGVSSTYRCNIHQDHLFTQGRTRDGNIVTNARGGQSIHNHMPHNALAFDIFQNIRGQEWNNPTFFATAGAIWTEMGGEWGGNWASFPDRPHFQYTGGLTLRDLQNGKILPMDAQMPWEKGRFIVEQRNFRILGKDMQVDAILLDGRTFAMVRPVLEAMGYVVNWEEATGTVVIDAPSAGR
ncbi:MAG: M15 family metallopeptidase [Defluviitaleaceae bacterium]|nr:M15 family metallopeptidase [Defluviitaleaceae bacterium]